MKRSKAPSAMAAKKARTDELQKTEPSNGEQKATKDETKDAKEMYPSSPSTPAPTPTPTPVATQLKIPLANKSGGSFRTPFKSPITSATKAISVAKAAAATEEPKEAVVYTVLWCNYSTKKHKTWNDGIFPTSFPFNGMLKGENSLVFLQECFLSQEPNALSKIWRGKNWGKRVHIQSQLWTALQKEIL